MITTSPSIRLVCLKFHVCTFKRIVVTRFSANPYLPIQYARQDNFHDWLHPKFLLNEISQLVTFIIASRVKSDRFYLLGLHFIGKMPIRTSESEDRF